MKILAILAALFLSIGYGHAQTYEKFVEKSFDFLDKNDLVSAEESLRAAMRLEPGNPNNYALLIEFSGRCQLYDKGNWKMPFSPIPPP